MRPRPRQGLRTEDRPEKRTGAAGPGGRRRNVSVYGRQLREAQKLKIAYGVREKQMRRLVSKARRHHDSTAGEARMELLERRLDNVVFRLGLASTRRQARQFINHGHVLVDGRRLDIPSAIVADGNASVKPGSPVAPSEGWSENVGLVRPGRGQRRGARRPASLGARIATRSIDAGGRAAGDRT